MCRVGRCRPFAACGRAGSGAGASHWAWPVPYGVACLRVDMNHRSPDVNSISNDRASTPDDGPRVLRRVPTGLSAPAIRGATAGRLPPPAPAPRPRERAASPDRATVRHPNRESEIENRESGPARS